MDDARRGSLLAAKLRVLVRPLLDGRAPEPADYAGGAALVADGTAWLLLDREPLTALGPALVWADRRGITDLHLVVEQDTGSVARRATLFTAPPTVWTVVDGTSLVAAEPGPVPVAAPAEPAPELAALLVDADLEVLVEGGLVRGEILGLEVARIVHGTSTGGIELEVPLLEVGVGRADRELTTMLHGNLDPVDQLVRVSEIVRAQRRVGAEPHPLNQLVPERWMRALLVADPGRIDLAHLRPVPAAIPRPNLRDKGVAVAVGETSSGAPVVVACSVGIDLDLVPAAADTRLAIAPDAELLLVVPERDAHPVTVALAARLISPARVVSLPGDWRL